MIVSSRNVGKVREESKFPFAIGRRGVDANSIICQFCKCLVHKRCSGIRGKLKHDEGLNVKHMQINK